MTRKERTRYEALLRVRDFGAAHVELFPESSRGGQAFAEVGAAVEAFETSATSKIGAAKDGRREKAVARAAVKDAMRAIARTARSVRPRLSKGENKLLMPDNTSDAALLRAAEDFVKEGTKNAELLIALGLPSTFVADLVKAVDAFEKARTERHSGRRSVRGAQIEMTAALSRGAVALATLDAVVINLIGKDPGLSAAWDRDRRIVGDKARKRNIPAAPTAADGAGKASDDTVKKAS